MPSVNDLETLSGLSVRVPRTDWNSNGLKDPNKQQKASAAGRY
jgi:hypothetical protein